ncbi:uncharacterized protein [Dermacentor albipictus]|uniref:uncharacterized protein n=1 Tax=Dermacentor albipictus TaxID=60249 RepID=UPI0038FCBE62
MYQLGPNEVLLKFLSSAVGPSFCVSSCSSTSNVVNALISHIITATCHARLYGFSLGKGLVPTDQSKGGPVNPIGRPFMAGVRVVATFHSMFACNVLRNVRSEGVTNATTHTLRSLYVGFVCLSFLIFAGEWGYAIKQLVEVVMKQSGKHMLYTSYLLFFLVFTALTAIVNYALTFFYAPSYQQLMRACSKIEEQIVLPPGENQAALRYSYTLIAWQIIASSWSLYFGTRSGLYVDKLPMLASNSRFLQWLFQALKCYGILQASVWGMIPRLWMAYFARTFRCYIRVICEQLDACLRSSVASSERMTRRLDALRQDLERVKTASGVASRIVSPGFTAALFASVVNVTVALHCASSGTVLGDEYRIFFSGWVLLQMVSLTWPVLGWQRIKHEVAKLRYVAQDFELPDGSPTILSEHILMLLYSLEGDVFTNAFGGFIAIQPSLVASVIGTVAAYTVLLRQTADVLIASGETH